MLDVEGVLVVSKSSQASDERDLVERENWAVERRGDGAVLVRVPSRAKGVAAIPDAVFAFRAGDPQYHYWEQQLQKRERRA